MSPSPTSYDAVAYPSYTHPQTHPDRLAVIGALFGLKPAPANRSRVLELGCGNGTNLIPMAWALPQSEFTGIDLAAKPIACGNEMLRALGLTNTRLIHGSITEIDHTWGSFDYIIAHGLYSWIPVDVRDQLLRICRDRLAPQGIAFVSYNALPGGHLRNMLREMMLFHVRGFDSAEERIKQSLALVRFLADAQDTGDEYRLWMRAETKRIAGHSEGHLYHDELGELNEPLYFTQFIERASHHDLQYLGEADYFEMSDYIFKPAVRETLAQLAPNRLLHEQYLDFLKCRRFRQTLLCHREVQLQVKPATDTIKSFLISSAAECTSGQPDPRPGAVNTFTTPKGGKFDTDFALGKAALNILRPNWPMPVPFEALLEESLCLLQKNAPANTNVQESRAAFGPFLLELYGAGLVEFRSHVPTLASTPGERPVASAIARWQAGHGNVVTSLFHIAVQIEDEIGRSLLTWLDGTCNRKALLDKLWHFLKSKNALVLPGGDETAARQNLEQELEKNLVKLARLGLLVE